MSIFNFFKKKKEEAKIELKIKDYGKSSAEILRPKECPSPINQDVENQISQIDWPNLKTAYGDAENTIPLYLRNIYCSDDEIAMDACHQLWCSLCHQHSYISSASLPSYEIIRNRLIECEDNLKVELLDILYGFACCSNHITEEIVYGKLLKDMKSKLLKDQELFVTLAKHHNEEVQGFAELIIEELENRTESNT